MSPARTLFARDNTPMDLREIDVKCPYCGESIGIMVDPVSGEESYTEDCSACCRPMVLTVDADDDGEPVVTARREEGS